MEGEERRQRQRSRKRGMIEGRKRIVGDVGEIRYAERSRDNIA